MYFIWFFIQKTVLRGEDETNPDPTIKSYQNVSICHWNLDSIGTHSFVNMSPLKANISIYNFDNSCLSETYLDSSIIPDNDNKEISGYDSIRADHPSNSKWGGIKVYYKNSLTLRPFDIRYLKECITFVFKLKIGKKTG